MKQEELFLTVLSDHKGILYKVARAYCPDPGHRKDLIQEITLQLWRSFDKYHGKFKYSTWIYKVALNVAISYYRKISKEQERVFSISDSILNFPTDESEDIYQEDIRLLYRFIEGLKPIDKAIMLLYLEEKSHQEMAKIIGISPSNVSTKLHRIKTYLKEQFSQHTA
ncbi:RNA polymerase sigma-70 factor (ECF subfamily) [Dyadobacter jejuensis]|uniref:RNA polymerase sigma-70 factor (ECF subfamily) n=2 Tax=Dyadobacter jejuensis TaxID=1082580 RepID=A0A316AMD1_9BACT|nr:RNA polymerase sigma-70 factor (ECF subfamily) [Dyadobacter jejuensis]